MSSITIVDNQKGAADTRRQATLSGILATMGGLSITMSLIGKDNIIDPGQWPGNITVTCTREEAEVIAEIVNEILAEQRSKDTGSIIFQNKRSYYY